MDDWFVVRSAPNLERRCLDSFGAGGVEAYLPLVGRRVASFGKVITKLSPLFPRYLFARDTPGVDPVSMRYYRGVSDLVRKNGLLFARLADDVVQELRRREGPDGYIDLDSAPAAPGLSEGDAVIYADGRVDWIAKFLRYKPGDRAVVLLTLFNNSREAVVNAHQLTKVLK